MALSDYRSFMVNGQKTKCTVKHSDSQERSKKNIKVMRKGKEKKAFLKDSISNHKSFMFLLTV